LDVIGRLLRGSVVGSIGQPDRLAGLRGVFLHHQIANVRAQFAEARVFVQPVGTRVGERHVDDGADARRPRRHDDDARRQVDRLFHRVRDQHHRLALGLQHLQQQVLHGGARLRVQRAERLVHQQEFGLHRIGARQRQPLPHAAGQVLGIVVGEIGQPHQPHVALHDGVALGPVGAVGRQREAEADVLLHREPREDAVLLEDHPALGAGPLDRPAVQPHAALAGLLEARGDVHQRGLAAA
jgi:hypothetical protein